MERRNFVKKSLAVGAMAAMPIPLKAFEGIFDKKPLRIGIVADVHQDIIHDGVERLRFFMEDMKKRQPNFIIQLGDFALPRKRNQPFLDVWNEFEGSKYHVLGNHDMLDLGFTREQTMTWWQMGKRYYTFDHGGLHFIVLDGNDKNPKPWSGYDRYIGDEQKEWLKSDLENTRKPTIVFCHQSMEAEGGVANGAEIRAIFEEAKISTKQSKVIACFSGHHHTDYVKTINDIPYIQINSMSYKWVGDKYQYHRFAPHIEAAYPNLSKTCPYRNPLYTLLTLDMEKSTLHLEGRETQFIPPTPHELKIPHAHTMHSTITEQNVKVSI
ncbi:metallophosphoesterase [Allomuricauda sp. SCSIO 65647]|uniref:metallophosphoesterase family protein n=1 Tax=Allomuricauda sp. SCSIO 65647 TaxID=2908843 RepID=UPI001F1F0470|nr:metallophosphoesterase [Muricauda sp. SCSIO 65647]UJH68390.1 metallophosphoesterase [Muricauda sp. SCSIO 65647]